MIPATNPRCHGASCPCGYGHKQKTGLRSRLRPFRDSRLPKYRPNFHLVTFWILCWLHGCEHACFPLAGNPLSSPSKIYMLRRSLRTPRQRNIRDYSQADVAKRLFINKTGIVMLCLGESSLHHVRDFVIKNIPTIKMC